MAIPGLFIEYLISGALALVWLAPLLAGYGYEHDTALLPLVALGLYVVGMAIDFIAFWLVKPFKRWVRKMAWGTYARPGQSFDQSSTTYQVRFALHSPEILKEVTMRGSRDRIARGGIVNVLALSLCVFFGIVQINPWVLLGLLVLSAGMWGVFESMSYAYELRADYELRKKLSDAEAVTKLIQSPRPDSHS